MKKNLKEFINKQIDKKLNKRVDNILEYYYNDLELADIFLNLVNANNNINSIYDEYNPKNGMYKLDTKLTKEQSIELAHKFFQSISSEFDIFYTNLINNPDFIHFDKKETNPRSNRKTKEAYLTEYGDLRDLYTIVHEISHLLDYKKNNITSKLLTETNAQCMERLLDTFLLNLSNEELQRYNIDKKTLIKDIYNRNIATFFTRLDMIKDISSNNLRKKATNSSYMLAELYCHYFRKLNFNEGKEIIIKLIDYIRNDKFNEAINLFDIDISKYNLERKNLITELLDYIYNLYCKSNLEKLNDISDKDKLTELKELRNNVVNIVNNQLNDIQVETKKK